MNLQFVNYLLMMRVIATCFMSLRIGKMEGIMPQEAEQEMKDNVLSGIKSIETLVMELWNILGMTFGVQRSSPSSFQFSTILILK
jgi:hypothetical protein